MVNVADYTNKNLGKVEIAPEVLSVIAIIATSEVEGISGHFADLKNTNLEKINHKNFNKLLKFLWLIFSKFVFFKSAKCPDI
ncbi:MAG: Asp23/Gls24 family envelope stress response protein, partial [Staphylococcus lugdunensis]|nr:Asp23/Gls24 family envelope stress response protein [Staphylococcus lugdunensis]